MKLSSKHRKVLQIIVAVIFSLLLAKYFYDLGYNSALNSSEELCDYPGGDVYVEFDSVDEDLSNSNVSSESLSELPEDSDSYFVIVNDNMPYFTEDELVVDSYEKYSELDNLGRCGTAEACIGVDIMPTEERGNIGSVKPTGWQSVKYDCVDGKYLYNRCHLIGFQLTGENANKKNLITGTRSFNVDGMLPFENMVADYVVETENHVMYRVTPVFLENELVSRGV